MKRRNPPPNFFKQKTQNKTIERNTNKPIITINKIISKNRFSKWVKKQTPAICFYGAFFTMNKLKQNMKD